MKVIEHVEVEIKFSPEEKHAIKTIVDIDCSGLKCRICPLKCGPDGSLCIKGILGDIYSNYIEVKS